MFKIISATIIKLGFRGAFEHTIRHNISFKEGYCSVIVAKVINHFVVSKGELIIYHRHEN